jgi:hypothetical protein
MVLGHADLIRNRIKDLSKEGLAPKKIFPELAGEGLTTSLDYIYKVRSQFKKNGLVFPEPEEKPTKKLNLTKQAPRPHQEPQKRRVPDDLR